MDTIGLQNMIAYISKMETPRNCPCGTQLSAKQKKFCSRKCKDQSLYKDGLNSAGYKIININGKQVYEHRWLMEQKLNRKLHRTEHVHHKNGIKHDNRLENLEIINESDHHREHVSPSFDIEKAKKLYDAGYGYRKLAQIFGTARQNIRACFVNRGWHQDGRTKMSTSIQRKDHDLQEPNAK